jgi:hypothetical protein
MSNVVHLPSECSPELQRGAFCCFTARALREAVGKGRQHMAIEEKPDD